MPPRFVFRRRFPFPRVEFESKILPLLCAILPKRRGIDRGRRDNSYYDRERRVRRCFLEVIITCYQMTGLVEVDGFGAASAPLFEDSRKWLFCGVRERKIF
jgi:hypothetical protein